MTARPAVSPSLRQRAGFGTMFLVLFAVLAVLLYRSFEPGQIQFSNDGPFGRLASACHRLPTRFLGCWADLDSIGYREAAAAPNISFGLQWLLGPGLFAKFYAFAALMILGLGAWCFLRQSGLAPPAQILGGLAAALSSNFFSNACWGVAAHAITVGLSFFALAALADDSSRRRWLKVALSGLIIGMGVCEGDDVGALFSMLVAAFVLYRACVADGPRIENIGTGVVRVALIALFAGFLAFETVSELITTNIKGVAGTQQDAEVKANRWDWATQWSLPKREMLGLVVPGLFGYRLDTPGGANYWGDVGQDPLWRKYFANGSEGPPPPKGFKRYSGGGFYAGVLVVLVAVWTSLQSLRRQASVFGPAQRKLIWFWSAVALVSMLLSFGRFAPFYRWVYALPYVSTIRNPVKFLYFLSFALVVLFAFGIDGLCRRYLQPAVAGLPTRWPGLRSWWTKAARFDRNWAVGCGVFLACSVIGWVIYASNRASLEGHLIAVQFADALAPQIASFSIGQVGWFVFWFVLAAGLLILVLSGAFAGNRARSGVVALGLLLVVDLGVANLPWIIYWDRDDKYTSNPVIDLLRNNPYEQRVAIVPFGPSSPSMYNDIFTKLYRVEWLQHQLPYYNIQSLDVVQMPRKQEDLADFERAFLPKSQADIAACVTRRWQLTNTRFALGPVSTLDYLNRGIDSPARQVRVAQRFNVVLKPGVTSTAQLQVNQFTASLDPNGQFALFEFPGALPRARLYSGWQVNTNHQETLTELASPAFDPEKTVLVAGGVPPSPTGAITNAGTVEFASYAPKDLVLNSVVQTPSVLLLNDGFDSNWHVTVDGQPTPLLRCNYLMQGVYVTPGTHTLEFRFQPPFHLLYVSLAAIALGLVLTGLVLVPTGQTATAARSTVIPQPQAVPKPQPVAQPRTKTARKSPANARRN